MRLARDEILTLIPHQGAMCLLDAVESWSEDSIRCSSASHRAADNPLRRDGRLSAVHCLEYGAQAMAIHGGLLNRRAGEPPRPGMLVAARDIELGMTFIDDVDSPLTIEAQRLLADGGNLIYAFSVYAGSCLLVRGRATVMSGAPA